MVGAESRPGSWAGVNTNWLAGFENHFDKIIIHAIAIASTRPQYKNKCDVTSLASLLDAVASRGI